MKKAAKPISHREILVRAIALNRMIRTEYNGTASLVVLTTALGLMMAEEIPSDKQDQAAIDTAEAIRTMLKQARKEEDALDKS